MRRSILALLLAAVALAACGGDDEPVEAGGPSTDPVVTMEGTITDVTRFEPVTDDCVQPDPDQAVSSDDPPVCSDPDTAPLGSILVEADPGSDRGEKIVFTITQDTLLESGDSSPIEFDQLQAGQRADVGFDGMVAESYPGQARADTVTVLDGDG